MVVDQRQIVDVVEEMTNFRGQTPHQLVQMNLQPLLICSRCLKAIHAGMKLNDHFLFSMIV